jgi:hypothetical protein
MPLVQNAFSRGRLPGSLTSAGLQFETPMCQTERNISQRLSVRLCFSGMAAFAILMPWSERFLYTWRRFVASNNYQCHQGDMVLLGSESIWKSLAAADRVDWRHLRKSDDAMRTTRSIRVCRRVNPRYAATASPLHLNTFPFEATV